jgi:hypothetical protein
MDLFTISLFHVVAGLNAVAILASTSTTDAINASITNLINDAQLVAGAVCSAMLCWGGFSYAISQGNPIKMERAKHTLSMAAVGIAIVLLSLGLGSLIQSAIVVPK